MPDMIPSKSIRMRSEKVPAQKSIHKRNFTYNNSIEFIKNYCRTNHRNFVLCECEVLKTARKLVTNGCYVSMAHVVIHHKVVRAAFCFQFHE